MQTTIGLFPDVGASFFLSRMDGQLGVYLGLTSDRLTGWSVFQSGIATHYIPSDRLAEVEDRLADLNLNDESTDSLKLINAALEDFASAPDSITPELVGAKRAAIDRCFRHNTVEEIITDLRSIEDGSNKKFATPELVDWAKKTRETIEFRSPTSCKVALTAIRRGKTMSIDEVFKMDMRLASTFLVRKMLRVLII